MTPPYWTYTDCNDYLLSQNQPSRSFLWPLGQRYHATFLAAPSVTFFPFFSQRGLLAPTYRALKASSSRKVARQTHGMASTFRRKLYYSAGGEPKQLQRHIREHDSDIHQSERIRASICAT